MPGFLLDASATILCLHAGQARPIAVSPRVRMSGRPAVTQTSMYSVVGCAPPAGPPCVTAQWMTGAVRVRSGGQPLLVQDSQAVCAPTGTGLTVVMQQVRVRGT